MQVQSVFGVEARGSVEEGRLDWIGLQLGRGVQAARRPAAPIPPALQAPRERRRLRCRRDNLARRPYVLQRRIEIV